MLNSPIYTRNHKMGKKKYMRILKPAYLGNIEKLQTTNDERAYRRESNVIGNVCVGLSYMS